VKLTLATPEQPLQRLDANMSLAVSKLGQRRCG
jgi:hypothetical protein